MNANTLPLETLGFVVIGRNEGERLQRSLRSLLKQGGRFVVYVDSGSTDGSVEFAESLGVEVVRLDMSVPFTMARGRNAGFEHLTRHHPGLEYVHFVDGDCEVEDGWIDTALAAIAEHAEVSVVTGRRKERFPEASIYNRLADMEWNGPAGLVEQCGGDALYRVTVLREVGGFNPHMIAGEEPELCVRIRLAGGKILRLDAPMTRHDAAIMHFGQWWKRVKRSGHAYAEGMALHGLSPARHNVRPTLSALAYGLGLPLAIVAGTATLTSVVGSKALPLGAAAAAAPYLRLYRRVRASRLRMGDAPHDARLYAAFCVLGKFPEAIGVLTYAVNQLARRRTSLIEYKN